MCGSNTSIKLKENQYLHEIKVLLAKVIHKELQEMMAFDALYKDRIIEPLVRHEALRKITIFSEKLQYFTIITFFVYWNTTCEAIS